MEVGADYGGHMGKIKIDPADESLYGVLAEGDFEGIIYYKNNIKSLIVEVGTMTLQAEYESKYNSWIIFTKLYKLRNI